MQGRYKGVFVSVRWDVCGTMGALLRDDGVDW